MRDVPAQVKHGLLPFAWARAVRFSIHDEVPLMTILVVPFHAFVHSDPLDHFFVLAPPPMQRYWRTPNSKQGSKTCTFSGIRTFASAARTLLLHHSAAYCPLRTILEIRIDT